MHTSSYEFMYDAVKNHLDTQTPLKILDVGSLNQNGTYWPIFDIPGWEYHGLDIAEGDNVDIVVDEEGRWEQIEDGAYDVVISGQCLEHCELPWVIAKAMERVCKVGGIAIIIVPWIFKEHRYPIDCWRMLPDGMKAMMTKHCRFETIECTKGDIDTCFVGRRIE